MTEKTEIANVETVVNALGEVLIEETKNYKIFKLADGTFKKTMKYEKFWTFTPETEEEVLTLFQLFNEQDNENVTPMSEATGEILSIKNVFFNPYDSFNEETGINDSGVNTTIETQDGKYFVTSSKSVYFNLQNIFNVFGTPNTEKYLPVKVAIVSTKKEQGKQITLKAVGLDKEVK